MPVRNFGHIKNSGGSKNSGSKIHFCAVSEKKLAMLAPRQENPGSATEKINVSTERYVHTGVSDCELLRRNIL